METFDDISWQFMTFDDIWAKNHIVSHDMSWFDSFWFREANTWLTWQENNRLNVNFNGIFLVEKDSYISLDSPRKILWQQNHENSFIEQGISFAAQWLWNCIVYSMIFIESVQVHSNVQINDALSVVYERTRSLLWNRRGISQSWILSLS